ncbi:unannotated protein [freshwater metagenome]|uniref:Unannotated protein n=1 Tax=freshwater metagenome TaxID=449393 RepID=A0A6J6UB18_9ZZZZ|nr:hypothetical protein [Actinomycetota bacterium]
MDGQGEVHTGVPAVDAVIASVESLAERPLGEHAEVFTTAQERLRRALDADPDAPAPHVPAPTARPVPAAPAAPQSPSGPAGQD